MAVSDLLGRGLPAGTSVSIKIGGEKKEQQQGQQRAPSTSQRVLGGEAPKPAPGPSRPPPREKDLLGGGGVAPPAGEPPTGAPPIGPARTPGEGRCPDPNEVWRIGLGCVPKCEGGQRWSFIQRKCIDKTFRPWEACEEKGGVWKADPIFPNQGTCEGISDYDEGEVATCEENGGIWDYKAGICNYPGEGVEETCFEECIRRGDTGPGDCRRECAEEDGDVDGDGEEKCPDPNEKWDAITGQCVPIGEEGKCPDPNEYWHPIEKRCKGYTTPAPPPPPGMDPETWSAYWAILFGGDEEFGAEMEYWGVLKEDINRGMHEGWLDVDAMMAAEGYAYGTDKMLARGMYQGEWARAINKAYQDIVHPALDRHLQKVKIATDFFLGDKALDIQNAFQQGQLTLDYFIAQVEEQMGWANLAAQLGISEREAQIAAFRAMTERAAAQAATDQNWMNIWSNFLSIALQLGMSETEASEFFTNLAAQYGKDMSGLM